MALSFAVQSGDLMQVLSHRVLDRLRRPLGRREHQLSAQVPLASAYTVTLGRRLSLKPEARWRPISCGNACLDVSEAGLMVQAMRACRILRPRYNKYRDVCIHTRHRQSVR